jgi:hypothetical protein
MASIKYDVTNAEVSDFEPVPAGIYRCKVEEATIGNSKSSDAPMLSLVLVIMSGDHKGRKFWYYVLLDGTQDRRLREIAEALALPLKGNLTTEALTGSILGVKSRIEAASGQYDAKGVVKNILPDVDGAEGDDEELAPYSEWEQSDLAEEYAVRELTSLGTKKKTKAALIKALEADDEAHADDDDEPEEDEEGEDEGYTMADLAELDRAGLKAVLKEEEIEFKVVKSTKDEEILAAIVEALEISEDDESEEDDDDEPEEDEEDEEEEEDDEPDGLDEMSRVDLKKRLKADGVTLKVLKSTTDDEIREAIREASGSDEPEEEEEDEGEAPPPYSEWAVEDLRKELKERGLKTEGRQKSVLVKRLEVDDTKDGEPF